VSTALRDRPASAGAVGNGGVAARRAVIRWAWRLFRREWRQQILIVALLAVAVAATVLGVAAAASAPADLGAATHGTADGALILPGSDPHLSADIAAIQRQYATGPVDVIENKTVAVPGAVATIDLRAQDPHGPYGRPMLALVAGRYPSGRGEMAVSSGVASLLNLRIGSVWHQGGLARRVTGLVENPANLRDQFVLVAPGQVTAPTQVTVLLQKNPRAFFGRAPHFPGGAQPMQVQPTVRNPAPSLSSADLVLVLAVFGLIFIGLVAAAGFTVIAQRRLRALGMLAAAGATDRNIRLVLVAGGAVAGIAGALIGAVLGLASWIAYAPRLQASAGHVIDPFRLPWPVVATAMALAVATAIAAAWRPARTAAKIPVVAALSGRPTRPKPSHRLAVPAIILLAAGLGCLASSGGWAALGTGAGTGGWAMADVYGGKDTLLLAAGIVATTAGALLLTPLAVAMPGAVARWAPVAVRLALRDIGRYRARSAAALAAVSFAAFLAVVSCVVATASYANPLTFAGPNLAPNQLIVYEPNTIGSGVNFNEPARPPAPSKQRALAAKVGALAATLHARFTLALDSAGRPAKWCTTGTARAAASRCGPLAANQANQRATLSVTKGTLPRDAAFHAASVDYQGPLYVATPALLHDYGINPSQIAPDTDILTSRAGLAAVAGLRLFGQGDVVTHMNPPGHEVAQTWSCPPASCDAHPKIQSFNGLPTGTSAPSTVITDHAVQALGQQLVQDGWLIQTAAPLTPEQINTARQMALAAGTRIETASAQPSLSQIKGWATGAGLLLALAVLAMTAGLIRAETVSDLRTLTAAGASATTRRTLAAATGGALGLLGALIGTVTAYLAVIAWAHASLGTTLGPAPATDLIVILVGLPVTATAAGWLLSGRQPPAIARQPLE
jgi:putative ABC transport system permease protein